ncbi:GNAT family N-acetyltransferase [Terribacillus halophilus]|uniref:GNAT family N-acetyltransferase n=1 Tax=Terribacillus halophilus TaxID=361279 RepID=UPI0015C3B016|nr:GNAT family N-acetyltransferase [Terribacillus halophilus]
MRTELRNMTESDFTSYIEEFIPDYAKDLSENFHLPMVLALEEAQQLLNNLLPDNHNTQGYEVCNIYSSKEGANIGVLWYNIQPDSNKAFVYHILIHDSYRRKGYATAVLHQLESEMKNQGITSLGLSVYGNNPNAYHLYKKLGYTTSSISMGKVLQQ